MLAATLIAALALFADEPERVEAGTVDAGLSSGSSRVLPIETSEPTSFETVTRLRGGDGEPGVYSRRAGAVQAIFRQGIYSDGYALVPPDTLFVIGEMPDWVADWFGLEDEGVSPPSPPGRIDTRLDLRVNGRIDTAVSARPGSRDPEPEAPAQIEFGIFTSEVYRVRRVRALLDESARIAASSAEDGDQSTVVGPESVREIESRMDVSAIMLRMR